MSRLITWAGATAYLQGVWLTALVLLVAPVTRADDRLAGPQYDTLQQAEVLQRPGARLPLDAELIAADGTRRSLGAWLDGRPAVLAPIYYECPNLCPLTLERMAQMLPALELPPTDYRVLLLTVAPEEAHGAAALAPPPLSGSPPAAQLHASAATTERLMATAGIGYARDAVSGQYAHPAVLLVLTAQGVVSRYLPALTVTPRDLRLALVEAGRGEVGGLLDQALVRCFGFDPASGQYTLRILGLLRLAGAATLALLAAALLGWLWRERRHGRSHR